MQPPAPAAPAAPAAIEDSECVLPAAVTAVDPVRSGTTPGALSELAPPERDVLGGSLAVDTTGSLSLDTVVAPAAFGTTKYIPVISDMRVQLYARQQFQRLGGALSLSYDSASGKLTDDKADRSPGPCTPAKERALMAARFERAYHNRFVVGAQGGAELLPILFGPKVQDPTSMAFVDPQPERFGGYRATVHLAYFANRAFGMWLVGGVAGSRALHGVRGVNLRGGIGLDLAYQFALGTLRSDGFQPGITLGAFGRYAKCAASGGCDQDIHGYDTPVAFDSVLSAGAYLDFRMSNLVQLRLAIPTNYYPLANAPAGTLGGANIIEVLPTIAVSVASWGL
jgi:hypothetical protein